MEMSIIVSSGSCDDATRLGDEFTLWVVLRPFSEYVSLLVKVIRIFACVFTSQVLDYPRFVIYLTYQIMDYRLQRRCSEADLFVNDTICTIVYNTEKNCCMPYNQPLLESTACHIIH